MKNLKNKISSLCVYRRKQRMMEHAKAWETALPDPSDRYPNLIFLYSEELATKNRELLFQKMNSAAKHNNQTLVISDCHYSRGGLYVVFDEIGADTENSLDIDEIVERWNEQENAGT